MNTAKWFAIVVMVMVVRRHDTGIRRIRGRLDRFDRRPDGDGSSRPSCRGKRFVIGYQAVHRPGPMAAFANVSFRRRAASGSRLGRSAAPDQNRLRPA